MMADGILGGYLRNIFRNCVNLITMTMNREFLTWLYISNITCLRKSIKHLLKKFMQCYLRWNGGFIPMLLQTSEER